MRLESLLFLIVCVSLVWIPLPGASNRVWSMMGWSALIFTVTAIWSFAYAFGWVKFSAAIKTSWLPLSCLMLMQLWVFLQWNPWTGWTLDSTASFYQLLLGLAYTFLFAMILQLLNPARAKRLLIIIFASAVFQALYGAMMVLSGAEMGFFIVKAYFKGQATGTFINPNHFSDYLILGLSIGVAVLMNSLKNLKGRENLLGRSLQVMMSGSIAWRLALIVLVVGLVMSMSRMGNIAFVAALCATSGIYMLVKRRLMVVWVVFLASILLIDTLIIGTKFGVDRLVSEMAETVVAQGPRASVLDASWPMVGDFFWLGSGAGSYYSVFPMYRVDHVGVDFFNHAHNDYLEFMIELGLIGVIPLAIFVLASLHACYLALQRKDEWAQITGFAALMSIIAIMLHSTADFSLRIPAYAATLIALLAVLYFSSHTPEGRRRKRKRRSAE